MLNVFVKKSAEVHVELSDGRMIPLEDLVRDYERLLREKQKIKLKVGEWFRIDRNVIDENRDEIYQKCIEVGTVGERLWERFEKSNETANQNPDQYPRVMEVFIFQHDCEYKTEQKMRDMCVEIGDGMCDEIICDFELQMRICNGESVDDLVQKADKLPRVRVIKLRDGGTGCWGGGADESNDNPPADIRMYEFDPRGGFIRHVPYAFRRVLS